jgi:hypothetical protein
VDDDVSVRRDFYDRFSNHKATVLKADGRDILAVTMALNPRGESNIDL